MIALARPPGAGLARGAAGGFGASPSGGGRHEIGAVRGVYCRPAGRALLHREP